MKVKKLSIVLVCRRDSGTGSPGSSSLPPLLVQHPVHAVVCPLSVISLIQCSAMLSLAALAIGPTYRNALLKNRFQRAKDPDLEDRLLKWHLANGF